VDEFELDPSEIHVDVYRPFARDAPEPIRVDHLPTGVVVTVGDQATTAENRLLGLGLRAEKLSERNP
jgi:protein subunit release factor A